MMTSRLSRRLLSRRLLSPGRLMTLLMTLSATWLILAGVFGTLPHATAQAQAEVAAITANGWTFTDVIRVGQQGFSQVSTGRVGPNGVVVVSGQRNGQTGLFRVEGGTVVDVATDGMALPGGLGTLTNIGASSFQYAILPDGDVLFKARATGGSLNPQFTYVFRWRDGGITLAQPATETDLLTRHRHSTTTFCKSPRTAAG